MKLSNLKLAIGIPCSFPMVYTAFFDSFIQMEKPDFMYVPAKNGPISEMRDYIVKRSLMMNCSHVLMMDTDQIYEKETIPKLLRHNVSVVHARVFRRYPPFDSLLYNIGPDGYYQEKTDYEEGDMVSVDACGTGCVLYNTDIFRVIPEPWFEMVYIKENGQIGKTGEDFNFCEKLKKAGYDIKVDTSIKVGHLGLTEVNQDFSVLYQSLKRRQTEVDSQKDEIKE